MRPLKRACAKAEWCLESRLFRGNGDGTREGKREEDPGGARRGGKKVVDALRISDHNLISLLQTTQRC
ncbi:hypothetical protein WG70_14625 [Burkholderia oklahomensis EO147]|nr:hypothetical protein WG70_14625 [Burkholderia oklahomensis EO147]